MPEMTAKEALLHAAGFPQHGADVDAYDTLLQVVDWNRAAQMGVQRYDLSNEDDHWRILLNTGLNHDAVERVVDPSIRSLVMRLLKSYLSVITLASCSGHPDEGEEGAYITIGFLNPNEGREFTHECWVRDLPILGSPITPHGIMKMSVERSLDNRMPVTINLAPGPHGGLVAGWTAFAEVIDVFDGEGVDGPDPAFKRPDPAEFVSVTEAFRSLLEAHK